MKTLLAILLNVLGITIYFLTRYGSRAEKDKDFSLAFWWKDNWNELVTTVLFDAAVMILFLAGDIELNISQFIPEWLMKVGGLTIAFALGLGLAALIYEIFKKKIKAENEKLG